MEQVSTIAPIAKTKINVGWFSFTCCEDSTILLTELLNDHMDEWKKIMNFQHLKALKTKNSIDNLDIAFIEGAISSETQANEVKRIRENARYVIAIGSCACNGLPSASRNQFTDKDINEKIQWYLSHFDYSDKVKKLEEVIRVDDKVDGCPMSVPVFLQTVEKYVKLFNGAQ